MPPITIRTLAALACLAVPLGAEAQPGPPAASDGPVFTPAQMEQGIGMTATDCAAYRSTVWVALQETGLCFRYYLSSAGGSSQQAVYYLSGDKSGETLAYKPADLDAIAAGMSRQYGRPAVYLARMGLDGSSGWHAKFRRTWFEVRATHLAIDAINARHGFTTIHVMGQSGGGHLTGALLGTRSDLGCALPGSGPLAFDERDLALQERKEPIRRSYDPHSALERVVRTSLQARILVVTDPGDKRVPAALQTGFVRDVQRAGGRIAQFFVTATDELSHGSTPYLRLAMAECLKGTSDAEIGAKVARLSEERWQRELARSAAAPSATASAGPVPTAVAPSAASGRPVLTPPVAAHVPSGQASAATPRPIRSYVVAGSPPPPPPFGR